MTRSSIRRQRVLRVCTVENASLFDITIGNENVPTIIINNTINLSLKTAIGISVISNRNSFRVLFDRIVFVYILFENCIYILG